MVCSKLDGDNFIQVLGGSGHYESYFGEKLVNVDSIALEQVEQCFESAQHCQTDSSVTFIVKSKHRQAAIYLECEHKPSDAQLQFAEIFLTNVSVALDNVRLFVKLRDAAYKDVLTGISNRTNFIERVVRYQKPHVNDYVFVLIDVIGFADINNGLGQEIGNHLLIEIVKRLKDAYPDAKLLSRIGADVFAFIISQTEFDLEQFNDVLSVPFSAGEHILPVDFRIGLCQQQDFQSTGLDTLKVAYLSLIHI